MSGLELPKIPSHIPGRLVYDFDYFAAYSGSEFPQIEVARRLHAEAPDIFYTPRNGGHWVVTRFDDGMEISRQYDRFSSDPKFDVERQASPRFAPMDYDPPEHTELRRVISPAFSPAAITGMMADIRELACELIEGVYPKGGCEFVGEIAQIYPITIFMRMANAPMRDRPFLLDLVGRFLRAPEMESRKTARKEIGVYLTKLLAEREQNPGDDLLSLIVTSRLPERALTRDEHLGFASLTFVAGLDTVMATLSTIMYFLGRNPSHYRTLVADPDAIKNGMEELIRAHSTNCTRRGITDDFDYKGVHFKQGDRLVFIRPVMGMDDRHFPNPENVKFDRRPVTHLAFGAGVHRCIGSHLARTELQIFLEEWTRRIPQFSAGKADMHCGAVWSPSSVPLKWNVV